MADETVPGSAEQTIVSPSNTQAENKPDSSRDPIGGFRDYSEIKNLDPTKRTDVVVDGEITKEQVEAALRQARGEESADKTK